MTDIKMSEVFGGDVTSKSGEDVGKGCFDWDCGVLRKVNGGHIAEFDEVTESMAAAHAINNHDRLVAENEALKAAVTGCIYEQLKKNPYYNQEGSQIDLAMLETVKRVRQIVEG